MVTHALGYMMYSYRVQSVLNLLTVIFFVPAFSKKLPKLSYIPEKKTLQLFSEHLKQLG